MQLTQEQRYQIQALMKADHNQTEIAGVIGVDKSTISRELKCNCGLRGYRPNQAQHLTDYRHKEKAQSHITKQTWDAVEQLLREDWSEERSRIGDWEVDTVIGKPGGAVLVTLAERKTRLSLITLARDKTAAAVREALLASLQPHVCHVHTLTYDNGKEFAHHEAISEALEAEGFLAHHTTPGNVA